MEYAVETIHLTKTFSDLWGRRKVFAVDDLNLTINKNEVFGLLGPNGSGKTTTIKMLLGLLYPTKGRALLLGGSGSDPKINKNIGFLPEESYLYKYLNPRETLDFYGRLFGLPRSMRKERIETLLDMVGLKAVANRQVGSFSKGMARRIGLAQALINDPDLLILDEPTTGLDPIGTRQIKDLIINLAQRGKTILLCSHLLADVEDVCDRIAILYGGKIQAQGKVKNLLEQADKRQISTGKLSDKALEKIKKIIEEENSVFQVSSPIEKLETFFVRTVKKAQKQAHPTSGAVSTTAIGGFLASDSNKETSVLDDLIQGDTPEEPVKTKDQDSTADTSDSKKQDTAVLQDLVKPVIKEADKPQTDTQTPVGEGNQKQSSESKKDIQQDILRQLVDPSKLADSSTSITKKGDQDNA